GAAGRLRRRVPGHLQQLDRREGGEGDLAALGAVDGGRRPPHVPLRHPSRRAALHPHRPAAWAGASLAHLGRRRDARRSAVRARLDDLRRARIPQHRRHDGRHRSDRHHRADAGEVRVPEDRGLHGGALGHGGGMTDRQQYLGQRNRSILRASVTLACAAAVYELAARSGYFAPALLPTLPTVIKTLYATILDGSMIQHAVYTLYRVMIGFGLAVAVGIPLGI